MTLPKYSGIYKIINLVNKKIYIGQAINIYLRWLEHKCRLRNNYNEMEHLQRAWNKYGEENFKFEVVEKCEISELINREHYWCTLLKAHDRNKGYNVQPTERGEKRLVSEETKKKMSLSMKGKVFPDSRNKKISDSKKGKPRSRETKDKLSKYWREELKNDPTKNPMYGKKHSIKSREKMSKKAKTRIIKKTPRIEVYKDGKLVDFLCSKDVMNKYTKMVYYYIKTKKEYNGYTFVKLNTNIS